MKKPKKNNTKVIQAQFCYYFLQESEKEIKYSIKIEPKLLLSFLNFLIRLRLFDYKSLF